MNLENIMVKLKNPDPKDTSILYESFHMRCPYSESRLVVTRGWMGGGNDALGVWGFPLGGDEMSWNLIVQIVARLCEYSTSH